MISVQNRGPGYQHLSLIKWCDRGGAQLGPMPHVAAGAGLQRCRVPPPQGSRRTKCSSEVHRWQHVPSWGVTACRARRGQPGPPEPTPCARGGDALSPSAQPSRPPLKHATGTQRASSGLAGRGALAFLPQSYIAQQHLGIHRVVGDRRLLGAGFLSYCDSHRHELYWEYQLLLRTPPAQASSKRGSVPQPVTT